MSSKETVRDKAVRYISEGRVAILDCRRETGLCVAQVRGSKPTPYHVKYLASGWTCSCEARVRCAHIEAVALVCPIEEDPKPIQQAVVRDPIIDEILNG